MGLKVFVIFVIFYSCYADSIKENTDHPEDRPTTTVTYINSTNLNGHIELSTLDILAPDTHTSFNDNVFRKSKSVNGENEFINIPINTTTYNEPNHINKTVSNDIKTNILTSGTESQDKTDIHDSEKKAVIDEVKPEVTNSGGTLDKSVKEGHGSKKISHSVVEFSKITSSSDALTMDKHFNNSPESVTTRQAFIKDETDEAIPPNSKIGHVSFTPHHQPISGLKHTSGIPEKTEENNYYISINREQDTIGPSNKDNDKIVEKSENNNYDKYTLHPQSSVTTDHPVEDNHDYITNIKIVEANKKRTMPPTYYLDQTYHVQKVSSTRRDQTSSPKHQQVKINDDDDNSYSPSTHEYVTTSSAPSTTGKYQRKTTRRKTTHSPTEDTRHTVSSTASVLNDEALIVSSKTTPKYQRYKPKQRKSTTTEINDDVSTDNIITTVTPLFSTTVTVPVTTSRYRKYTTQRKRTTKHRKYTVEDSTTTISPIEDNFDETTQLPTSTARYRKYTTKRRSTYRTTPSRRTKTTTENTDADIENTEGNTEATKRGRYQTYNSKTRSTHIPSSTEEYNEYNEETTTNIPSTTSRYRKYTTKRRNLYTTTPRTTKEYNENNVDSISSTNIPSTTSRYRRYTTKRKNYYTTTKTTRQDTDETTKMYSSTARYHRSTLNHNKYASTTTERYSNNDVTDDSSSGTINEGPSTTVYQKYRPTRKHTYSISYTKATTTQKSQNNEKSNNDFTDNTTEITPSTNVYEKYRKNRKNVYSTRPHAPVKSNRDKIIDAIEKSTSTIAYTDQDTTEIKPATRYRPKRINVYTTTPYSKVKSTTESGVDNKDVSTTVYEKYRRNRSRTVTSSRTFSNQATQTSTEIQEENSDENINTTEELPILNTNVGRNDDRKHRPVLTTRHKNSVNLGTDYFKNIDDSEVKDIDAYSTPRSITTYQKYKRPVHIKPRISTVKPEAFESFDGDEDSTISTTTKYKRPLYMKPKISITTQKSFESDEDIDNSSTDTTTNIYQKYKRPVHMKPRISSVNPEEFESLKDTNENIPSTTTVRPNVSKYKRPLHMKPKISLTTPISFESDEDINDSSTFTQVPTATNIYQKYKKPVHMKPHTSTVNPEDSEDNISGTTTAIPNVSKYKRPLHMKPKISTTITTPTAFASDEDIDDSSTVTEGSTSTNIYQKYKRPVHIKPRMSSISPVEASSNDTTIIKIEISTTKKYKRPPHMKPTTSVEPVTNTYEGGTVTEVPTTTDIYHRYKRPVHMKPGISAVNSDVPAASITTNAHQNYDRSQYVKPRISTANSEISESVENISTDVPGTTKYKRPMHMKPHLSPLKSATADPTVSLDSQNVDVDDDHLETFITTNAHQQYRKRVIMKSRTVDLESPVYKKSQEPERIPYSKNQRKPVFIADYSEELDFDNEYEDDDFLNEYDLNVYSKYGNKNTLDIANYGMVNGNTKNINAKNNLYSQRYRLDDDIITNEDDGRISLYNVDTSSDPYNSPFKKGGVLKRRSRENSSFNGGIEESDKINRNSEVTSTLDNSYEEHIFADEADDDSLFEFSDADESDLFGETIEPLYFPVEKVTMSLPKSFLSSNNSEDNDNKSDKDDKIKDDNITGLSESEINQMQEYIDNRSLNADEENNQQELITVDPVQWYTLQVDGDNIEDIKTNNDDKSNTEEEKLITIDPGHWYTLNVEENIKTSTNSNDKDTTPADMLNFTKEITTKTDKIEAKINNTTITTTNTMNYATPTTSKQNRNITTDGTTSTAEKEIKQITDIFTIAKEIPSLTFKNTSETTEATIGTTMLVTDEEIKNISVKITDDLDKEILDLSDSITINNKKSNLNDTNITTAASEILNQFEDEPTLKPITELLITKLINNDSTTYNESSTESSTPLGEVYETITKTTTETLIIVKDADLKLIELVPETTQSVILANSTFSNESTVTTENLNTLPIEASTISSAAANDFTNPFLDNTSTESSTEFIITLIRENTSNFTSINKSDGFISSSIENTKLLDEPTKPNISSTTESINTLNKENILNFTVSNVSDGLISLSVKDKANISKTEEIEKTTRLKNSSSTIESSTESINTLYKENILNFTASNISGTFISSSVEGRFNISKTEELEGSNYSSNISSIAKPYTVSVNTLLKENTLNFPSSNVSDGFISSIVEYTTELEVTTKPINISTTAESSNESLNTLHTENTLNFTSSIVSDGSISSTVEDRSNISNTKELEETITSNSIYSTTESSTEFIITLIKENTLNLTYSKVSDGSISSTVESTEETTKQKNISSITEYSTESINTLIKENTLNFTSSNISDRSASSTVEIISNTGVTTKSNNTDSIDINNTGVTINQTIPTVIAVSESPIITETNITNTTIALIGENPEMNDEDLIEDSDADDDEFERKWRDSLTTREVSTTPAVIETEKNHISVLVKDRKDNGTKPLITKKILGRLAKFTMELKLENATEYIPSNVKVIEDLVNKFLNFTWSSNETASTNTISLRLKEKPKHYYIDSIQLSRVKDGKETIWVKNAIQPQKDKVTNQVYLEIEKGLRVIFSNIDFLSWIENEQALEEYQRTTTSKEDSSTLFFIELYLGVVAVFCLILIGIFITFRIIRQKKEKEKLNMTGI